MFYKIECAVSSVQSRAGGRRNVQACRIGSIPGETIDSGRLDGPGACSVNALLTTGRDL